MSQGLKFGGQYIKFQEHTIFISHGNKKLQIGFGIFNLPRVKTCPGMTVTTADKIGCDKYCYAKYSSEYPSIKKSREQNYQATQDPTWTYHLIMQARMPKYFRVHESGDFFNQWYLDDWFYIAKHFYNTIFVAFTKSHFLDFSEKPGNFKIFSSVSEDYPEGSPTLPKAYTGYNQHPGSYRCTGMCHECLYCWSLEGGDVSLAWHGPTRNKKICNWTFNPW